jgi:hypothetical protein
MPSPASSAHKLTAWLSLFGGLSTLLCCALPSLLVVLGLGATLAGWVGRFPQLVWLSEHKDWLFGTALMLLTTTFFVRRWAATLPCPLEARESCEATRRWSGVVYWCAVAITHFGVIFSYVLPHFLYGG